MSDVSDNKPAPAAPRDTRRAMVLAAIEEIEAARSERVGYAQALEELQRDRADIEDLQMRATRVEAGVNVLRAVLMVYDKQKDKGRVFPDMEDIINAVVTPFKAHAARRKA